MRKVVRTIDSISEWTAKWGRWFGVVLVLLVTYEVVMRYAFTKPSLWGYEVTVMLAASFYALSFSYAHLHNAHVRVDMIYAHLPRRMQATIDILGALLLFFPFIFMLTYTSGDWAIRAWATDEKMPITGWYPPAGPLRTLVFYGVALFALQGIAKFTRDVYALITKKEFEPVPEEEVETLV